MPRWAYRAYNRQGEIVNGRLTADDDAAAFRALEAQSLSPIELKPVVRKTKKHIIKLGGDKPETNLVFVRQLATLVGSGVPILRCIDALAELQTEEDVRQRLLAVAGMLRQGQPLSAALSAHMKSLPSYVSFMVEVGETTGELADALARASSQLQRDLTVAREIRAALSYPTFLVCFGATAILFMFAVVVPQFANMVAKSSSKLPLVSEIVINSGIFVRAHLVEIAVAVGSVIALFLVFGRRPGFKSALYQLTLALPGIGRVLRLSESARWASMLATLLASRVTITEAISVANRVIDGRGLARSLALVEGSVRRGTRLSDSLEDFTTIDPRVVEMVRIGEQSSGMDKMLQSAADLLGDESEAARKRFIGLIEPMAVLVIGGLVGLVVTALMLAITSLYDSIG